MPDQDNRDHDLDQLKDCFLNFIGGCDHQPQIDPAGETVGSCLTLLGANQ